MVSKKERKRRERKIPDWYLRGLISGNRTREFFTHMAFMVWKTWVTMLFIGGLLIVRRLSSQAFDYFDWLLLFFFVLPLLLAFLMLFSSNAESKAGMLAVRAQWEELIAFLPKYYRAVSNALGGPRAEVATRTWKAKALINLDREDEAIEEVEPLRDMEGVSEADYLMARVQILMAMDDIELAREEAQLLLEADPERIEAWGAICELESLHFDHAKGARLALDHAMTLKAWKNLGPAGDYLQGITLAAEGEYLQAIDRLRPFRIWAKSFSAQLPIAWMMWAVSGCVIAHAHMQLGDEEHALAIISDTRAVLEQQGLHGVLKELDRFLIAHPLRKETDEDQLSASNV